MYREQLLVLARMNNTVTWKALNKYMGQEEMNVSGLTFEN